MQSATARSPISEPWGGGTAWIGPTSDGASALGRLKRLLLGFRHDLKLYNLAKQNAYDLVIVKDKFVAVLLALLIQSRLHIPFVYWLSFPFPEATAYKARSRRWPRRAVDMLRSRFMYFVLYRIVSRRARHVFVQSRWMKEDLSAKGILQQRMTAVPMGVSLERIALVRGRRDSCNHPRAIYIGALNEARRIDFLLRAFARVLQHIPRAELYIVGAAHDPRDERKLHDLTRTLGMASSVHFTGQLPIDQAWELVSKSLIGVSPIPPTPEFFPSSPTKLVEYLALARAVVANDLPEQNFVIRESGGGRCVPYQETAFADAMAELLSDPALVMRMGCSGRTWVAQHRSYALISELVERALIDNSGGRSR